jgi:hypothetical protein
MYMERLKDKVELMPTLVKLCGGPFTCDLVKETQAAQLMRSKTMAPSVEKPGVVSTSTPAQSNGAPKSSEKPDPGMQHIYSM